MKSLNQCKQQVDPRGLHNLHDEWLHVAMRAAMGDTTLKTIPDLDNVERMERNPLPNTLQLELSQSFIKWYDLHLQVFKGYDQVNLFHQVFTKWYNKVHKVDTKVILYP